jgi:phenylalanyl-tRNA synthetase beta chain
VGKSVVGHVGKVDADLAGSFDIDADVFVASVNLDALHKGKTLKFQPIPEFPSVERDLVFLFDRGTESESVLQTAKRAAGQSCIDVRIFDLYDGKGVPEGKISLGIRFALQDAKRTLTQEDSDKAMQAMIDAISKKFDAELRG